MRLIALMSGVRIINIDILKSMEYKTGAFNRKMRALDDTEKLYSPQNYQNRGPEVILQEYNQIQLEGYKVQQEFFQMIQDARTIGLNDRQIRKKLKDQRIGSSMVTNLMKGQFTPINFSESRFEKKVDAVKRLAKEKTKENDDYNYRVGYQEENYLYPKLQLRMLKLSYKNKSLDPDNKTGTKANEAEENPNTSGIFGGPTLIQRGKNLIEKTLPGRQFDSKIQTKPLDPTPMPSKQFSQQQNVDPQTNLTGTETALLSPTEKVIAGRS